MSTEIFDNFPGRSFSNYDLLDEITKKHGLDRREAHDSINVFLAQIIAIDGDDVVLKREAANPELLRDNPRDLDVRYWLTISDETADMIRESFAAVYETD
ncbi:hypothetical protein [Streptomyces sp. NPDC048659]|uniref:hypothetical protein n=1 Tax=Streptomyces sp. NPDC048659 TaxID=3155489 RepID=UPI0034127D6A